MRRWLPALAAGCTLLAGCYVTHPASGDTVRPDAGPTPRRDTGTPPLFDAIVPLADSAIGPPDARRPGLDAFIVTRDAGRRDSGEFPDAGRPDARPRRDTGPPPDAGPPPGPRHPALRFEPSTYFETNDVPRFDADENSAFELWVRSRESGDADFCQKGDDIARHLFVGIRGGRIVMGWQAAPTSYFVGGPRLPTDEWVHLAISITEEPTGSHTARFFMNGRLRDERTGLRDLRRAFNDVGFRCGGANVDVDEIRVWRVARSEDSIRSNMGARISGSIPGMIAYWRLDERGQIVSDYTASGTVGILGRLTTPDPEDPTWIRDGVF